jgi:putative FmdB family regulatory protein
MPLYHYRCAACSHRFEHLVHTSDGVVTTLVQCPQCGSERQERQLTSFNVGGRSESGSAAADEPFCGRCGENRPPCSN